MQPQPDDPEADWTSPGVYEVDAGLFRIPLPLPEDGLRAVNVYAVRDGSGLVLVDSGWALLEARELLEQAVRALDLGLADIRHVVFVDPARDVMFAGDHVLPRITPSIGFEQAPAELPLGAYLDSLRLVRALPDRRLLPAHGPVSPSVHARIDELLDHHDVRLAQLRELVERGAATPDEVARRMRWTRRERRFDELDLISRCLAVTETMAHLDLLAASGLLRRAEVDGVTTYR